MARLGSVQLGSGKELECDYVLRATGWGDQFAFLSDELKEELGLPIYDSKET